jgi:hypothetical protein
VVAAARSTRGKPDLLELLVGERLPDILWLGGFPDPIEGAFAKHVLLDQPVSEPLEAGAGPAGAER